MAKSQSTSKPAVKETAFSATLICSQGCHHKLTWTTEHAASHYGLGVLLRDGQLLDGATLHASGARIETNDPKKTCGALGIPYPDRQLIEN